MHPRLSPVATLLFMAWALLHPGNGSGQSPLSRLGEFKVNMSPAAPVYRQSVASDKQGNFVVVWDAPDGSGNGVFARRYNTAGSPLSDEFRVNVRTENDQDAPAIAVANDGSFIVAWNGISASGNFDIYLRRFNSQGQALTSDLLVNAYTPGAQENPTIAISSSGGFVVAYQSKRADGPGGIYAQRFTSSGGPTGGEIRLSEDTTGDQSLPKVGIADDGSFFAVWRTDIAGTSDYEVWGRRYQPDGTPKGPQFDIPQAPGVQDMLDVAVTPDGRSAVVWGSSVGDSDGYGIRGKLYEANGVALRELLPQVNTFTAGRQSLPSVAFGPDGGLVITWTTANADGNQNAVAARRFQSDGTPIGEEFLVNTSTAGNQETTFSSRAICFDPSGNFVIAWADGGSDIRAEKFFLPNQGPPLDEFRVNTTTRGGQTAPVLAMNGAGDSVVVWVGPDGGGNTDIFAQRLNEDGLRVGIEILVNSGGTGTTGAQTQPAAAMDQTGRFVVVWTGVDGDGSGIYHQRFDASGTPLSSSPIRVNSSEQFTQDLPGVAMSPSGEYVIVWRGVDVSGDGVYGQRYNANGTPVATLFLENQFRVNVTAQGGQLFPSVAMGSDGRFVVAWVSQNQRGIQSYDDIYARVFAGDGLSVIRDEFEVNQNSVGDQTVPSVAMGLDGKFIIAWSSSPTNNGSGEIVARRFAATGQPDTGASNEFQVNDTTTRTQVFPSVAIDGAGRSLILWNTTQNSLGLADNLDVYAKRYDATGATLGGEFPLNKTQLGNQAMSNVGHRVAFDAVGNYLAVWQSEGQDGSGSGIFATRVTLAEAPTVKTLPVNPADLASTSALLTAEIDPNGQTVTAAFEYDEDPTFSSPEIKQVPGTFTGVNPPEIPALIRIDGLLKNVKYYYRARASFNGRELLGNVLDFTTSNAIPVATDDLLFVSGSQATFQPQANDSDADQIPATLKLVIPDKTARDQDGNSLGTLTLGSGDTTVTFIGQGSLDTATFKYQVQDSDGALSNEATVTLKSFASAGGTYQGLVTADDGTTGSLTLVLNRVAGAFSGSFSWKGITYPLDSAFPATGVLRFALEGTAFELQIQIFADGTILGVLFENNVEIANVDLDIIDGGTGGEPVPTGSYTTFLDLPEDDSTAAAQAALPRGTGGGPTVPGGAGYIVLKIKKASKRPATFVGKLPDGSKLSYGAPGLSRKRRYTLVKELYKISKGVFAGGIVGQPQFQGGDSSGARGTTAAAALQGALIWNKQPVPGATSFPEGFPPNLRLSLFALQFTGSKEPIDFDQGIDPNAQVEFKNGGLDSESYVTMYIDSRNHARVVLDNTPAFVPKLKIVPRDPLFSGSFIHPVTGKKSKYYGILQQGGFGAETSGRGYFRTVDPADPEGKREITGRVKLRKLPLTN